MDIMPLDSLNIKYLAEELNTVLSGGRIDKITMPEKDTVIFLVRSQNKNHSLLLCANPSYPRINITKQAFENPSAAPSFLMHLRKHLSGGKINSVCTAPFERVINISITSKSELSILEERTLCIELMGKYSNIILVNSEGIISESIRHIPADLSSKRIVLPGVCYARPPAQNKIDCSSVQAMTRLIDSFEGGNLANFIMTNVSGFAVSSINEAIFNVFKTKNVPCLLEKEAAKLSYELCSMYEKIPARPCVSKIENKINDFHFTPYFSIDNAEFIYFDTMSEAVEYFFVVGKNASFLDEKIKSLNSSVKAAMTKAEKRLAANTNKINECADAGTDKLYADLITANIYRLKKGMKSAKLENYQDENYSAVEILLDDKLSPQGNAQKYYKKYNKKKKTVETCNRMIMENKDEISYLESVAVSLCMAANKDEAQEIESELMQNGYIKLKTGKNNKKEKARAIKIQNIVFEDHNIFFGKNNIQNDFLTKNAFPTDVWLHTKDVHGSHVVIENKSKDFPPDKVIVKAASIAAYFSKAGFSGKTAVDYTFIKNVSKPKGAPPGKAVYENFYTVLVEPKEP